MVEKRVVLKARKAFSKALRPDHAADFRGFTIPFDSLDKSDLQRLWKIFEQDFTGMYGGKIAIGHGNGAFNVAFSGLSGAMLC